MTSVGKAAYGHRSMSPVPLIPFQRPAPLVFSQHALPIKPTKTIKPKTQKKAKMVSTSKKKPRFESANTDDIKQMPPDVQRLWRIMEKQDPNGEVFVSDIGIIILDGEGPEERTAEALGLKANDIALLRSFSVLDGPKANDPETATGLIFTPFQMVQMAYELGRLAEQGKAASDFKKAVKAAPPTPVEDDLDEDENEEFDDEENLDVVDEDEDEEDEGGEEDEDEDEDNSEDEYEDDDE